jgi:hypothetical protein
METETIANYNELVLRIRQLKAEKFEQEEELNGLLKEIRDSIKLTSIIKNSLHELTEDSEIQMDIGKAGLDIGTTALTSWIASKQGSIKGFVGTILLGMISKKVVNSNSSTIVSGLGKLIQWGYNKTISK